MWLVVRALLLRMSPKDMDDGGMYAWAAIVTVVGLVASYFIAVWWQKRKAGRKDG